MCVLRFISDVDRFNTVKKSTSTYLVVILFNGLWFLCGNAAAVSGDCLKSLGAAFTDV